MDLSARGKKRRCLECDEAFYDLNRDPAVCPYCGHAHPLDVFAVGKRPPPPEPKVAEVDEADEEDVALDDEDDDAVIDDEEDIDDDDDISKVSVPGESDED